MISLLLENRNSRQSTLPLKTVLSGDIYSSRKYSICAQIHSYPQISTRKYFVNNSRIAQDGEHGTREVETDEDCSHFCTQS